MSAQRFASFDDFYPFYLREHSSRVSRRLHVIGTSLAILLALAALVTDHWAWFWGVPIAGYSHGPDTFSSRRTSRRPSGIRFTACAATSGCCAKC
jgi:hypothetical protein